MIGCRGGLIPNYISTKKSNNENHNGNLKSSIPRSYKFIAVRLFSYPLEEEPSNKRKKKRGSYFISIARLPRSFGRVLLKRKRVS